MRERTASSWTYLLIRARAGYCETQYSSSGEPKLPVRWPTSCHLIALALRSRAGELEQLYFEKNKLVVRKRLLQPGAGLVEGSWVLRVPSLESTFSNSFLFLSLKL